MVDLIKIVLRLDVVLSCFQTVAILSDLVAVWPVYELQHCCERDGRPVEGQKEDAEDLADVDI